ncbi:MAG: TetR/AcrR family transcriptional regulator [Lachnospiraceae bacterium]|nr:TetR/AcrR family transcriptional regulator [Lachnospiraceae bacterium]
MAESRRKQLTKKLFKTALIELMQDKPFHRITIKEICAQADLNRTTFYLHYKDQKELLDDILSELREKTSEHLSDITYGDNENLALKKYLEFVKENAVLFRTILFRALMDGNIDLCTRDLVITSFIEDIRDRLPSFGSELENRYFYTYMIEGSVSLVARWIENDFDLTTDELANLISNLNLTLSKYKGNNIPSPNKK